MTEEITAAELEGMVDCAAEFHSRVKYPGEFNAAAFCAQWSRLMESGIGRVFVVRVDGVTVESIGLLTIPDCVTGDMVGVVSFWYVAPRRTNLGGFLYCDVEAWARANNIKRINCSARIDFRFMPMYRFLSKMGYNAKEAVFQKELS